jgi:hypothetical protein
MKKAIPSMPSVYTHTGRTSTDLVVRFSPSSSPMDGRDVKIPRGTLCHNLGDRWVVADLDFIQDKGSILYSDADIYGIPVPSIQISDVEAVSAEFQAETDRRQRWAMGGG